MTLLAAPSTAPDDAAAREAATRLTSEAVATLVFYSAILLVIVVFGGIAIWIAMRRFRDSIVAGRGRGATDSTDIWSMHKVPDDALGPDEAIDPDASDDNGDKPAP